MPGGCRLQVGEVSRPNAWASALERAWWQPKVGWLAASLWPLSLIYRVLSGLHRWCWQQWPAPALPVPVVVVGNLVLGGAGKTPTVMAVVQCLQAAGWQPGVISRGYGRQGDDVRDVAAEPDPAKCGDEPLLIHRRTGAPTWVGRDRLLAGQRLLQAHPQVDVLVADDGLQHHRLRRDLQVLVGEGRGLGNGQCLPAGPLRQAPAGQPPPRSLVLYNADQPSMAWPGAVAQRAIVGALDLAAWQAGLAASPDVLADLVHCSQRQSLLAAAGLAEPARFFDMLQSIGLRHDPLPLPDHFDFRHLPWPLQTADVLVTEKDAVKLRLADLGATRVWVLPLDFTLPIPFQTELLAALARSRPTHDL